MVDSRVPHRPGSGRTRQGAKPVRHGGDARRRAGQRGKAPLGARPAAAGRGRRPAVAGPYRRRALGDGPRPGIASHDLHQPRRDLPGSAALLPRVQGDGAGQVRADLVEVRRRPALEDRVPQLRPGLPEKRLRRLLPNRARRAGHVPPQAGRPVARVQRRASRPRRPAPQALRRRRLRDARRTGQAARRDRLLLPPRGLGVDPVGARRPGPRLRTDQRLALRPQGGRAAGPHRRRLPRDGLSPLAQARLSAQPGRDRTGADRRLHLGNPRHPAHGPRLRPDLRRHPARRPPGGVFVGQGEAVPAGRQGQRRGDLPARRGPLAAGGAGVVQGRADLREHGDDPRLSGSERHCHGPARPHRPVARLALRPPVPRPPPLA